MTPSNQSTKPPNNQATDNAYYSYIGNYQLNALTVSDYKPNKNMLY
jgi:hypothetical protein